MNRLAGWRAPVVRLKQTPSTQDVARRLAEKGSPEWTLVIAESQSRGRGRMGRSWQSSKGGLYLSIILRPKAAPRQLGKFNRAFAESLARALTLETGLPTTVKPPNDVLAARAVSPDFELENAIPAPPIQAFRKVSGILVEASGSARKTDWIVLGIGVNVNNRIPRNLPQAASLSALADKRFDIDSVCGAILDQLSATYGRSKRKK